MRRSLLLLTVLLLASTPGACTPEGDGTDTDAAPAQGSDTAPAPLGSAGDEAGPQAALPTPAHVLTITADDQGNVTVTPDCLEVNRKGSPVIAWESNPPGKAWIVAFGATTPFRNGRRVFTGGGQGQGDKQGAVDPAADVASYKYWVFWPDSEGAFTELDPKLVILDDPGAASDTMQTPALGGDRVQKQVAAQPSC